MAKKPLDRVFRIAVVGLSGDERTKGSAGVGKSCLCNRFVRPHADHFYKEHISVISQIDFSGRVINNDHFLYWGEVSKTLEDNTQVTCSIVELTEFIDDQSFQTLRSQGDRDYKKRCKTTLTSAEKLMYICKDQLGDEGNYDKMIMPDGKFQIDGFLVVYDVSHVQNRPPNKQATFINDLLSGPLHKFKKPCVLVATKCEEPENTAHEEVKQIKDKKKLTLVETSSFENVNVDFAFLTLVNLIDRTKRRPTEVPFLNGIRKQKEILDKVEDAYMNLLTREVTDYRDVWNRTKRKLADEDVYLTYLRYFGSEMAAKKFKSHAKKLKEAQQQRKRQQCLETLPLALKDMLPDLASIGGRDWKACQEILLNHNNFDEWFVRLSFGDTWRTSEYIDSTTKHIAVDFLQSNAVDCEKCFKAHEERLKEALKRERMKVEFGKLLWALNDVVLPGRRLEDTLTHLIDEESYRYLTRDERNDIYVAHQKEITEKAKKDFVELLLENIESFEDFDMADVNAHMEAIINSKLAKEARYKNLDNLTHERRLLLMKHAVFVVNPCLQTCPFQDKCMDQLINQILEQRVPKCQERETLDRWSETSSKLNLVILGENGLADELANEIRAQSVQEEYTLDGVIHSLELRTIDGDVDRPQNHITTPDFQAQGCICTFSSLSDLRYIVDSLRKSRLISSRDDIYATLQPELPIILLFARDLSVPESDLAQMRVDVAELRNMLFDCTIVDMPCDEATIWHGKKFHDSQISSAIRTIVASRNRSDHDRDDESHDSSQYEPDIRCVTDKEPPYAFIGSPDGTAESSARSKGNAQSNRGLEAAPPKSKLAAKWGQDLTPAKFQFPSHSLLERRKSPTWSETQASESHPHGDDDVDEDDILRIGMSLMCGDPNLPDLVLGPIISNDTCCLDPELNQTVNVDMFLSNVKRRVGIEITSFHQAKLYTDDIHHGYIMVYSTKRRASFETLKYFVKMVSPIPIEIVAVSDTEKFSSDYEMQTLIAEGNKLADETKNCTFITAGANFGNQSLAYSTFFTDAYEKMLETERVHEEIFGPLEDDSVDEERQPVRTPLEPPSAGFGENIYARPQEVKGMVYPSAQSGVPVATHNRARALSAGETSSLVAPVPCGIYDHLVRPSDNKMQQKLLRHQDKRNDGAVYDQPEKFPVSPRKVANYKGEEPVYSAVQKAYKPEPAPRRRSSGQTSESKDSTEDSFRRRCKTEVKRRSKDDANRLSSEEGKHNRRSLTRSLSRSSTRSSEADDEQGFVDNIIYDRTPGNGDMVKNPIYSSVGPPPPTKPKPHVPPKPLNMANYQQVVDKLSKPRDPTSPGGGGAGLLRPNNLPFSGTTTGRGPRVPLATPEKGVFSSPVETAKQLFGVGEYSGMRLPRFHRPHAGDEPSGDNNHSDPVYAAVKKPNFDKVMTEFSERHPSARGNASSDSDSKGSAEAERDQTHKRKRGSFRKKKRQELAPPGQHDDAAAVEDRIYDSVMSPDEDVVDPKVKNRQLREEEKNRKKEEKRQQAANRKKNKAQQQKQRQQQRQKQRQQSKKKNKNKAPVFAPYLVDKPKGTPLEEEVTEDEPIPKFVRLCIDFIEREGLTTEGIYRVSGKQADCDALVAKFKEDPNMTIDSMDISCHAVASAVKGYFKSLPDPLIPHDMQKELLKNFKGTTPEIFLEAMPEFFNKLSPIRLAILCYIMQHFARVTAQSEVNKMAEQNLTVCWWPTLLHPEFKSLEDVANESQLSAFVEQWVKHSQELFGVPQTEAPPTEEAESDQPHPPEDPLYAQVQMSKPLEPGAT